MPSNPTMRQKNAKKKFQKVLVEHRRQNPRTPEEEEEWRERKKEKKVRELQRQRAVRATVVEQTCALCNVVVDDWAAHHKGALHRNSRELLQPPYVQLLYKKKEKALERAERKKTAKLVAKASREDGEATQTERGADPQVKAEKAKAKAAKKAARRELRAQGLAPPAPTLAEPDVPLTADPWRSARRIQNGHLQTLCNICRRWVNHTDLRSHNNGQDHRAKLNALSPEDRDSYFTTRINEKKKKLEQLAQRAKKVVEPKTKYLNLQTWAKGISEGQRV